MDEYVLVMYNGWNDYLKRKAEKELNENEASILDELEELKLIIRNEKLPCCIDDSFLIRFLRCKKHDVRRSFSQLKRYSEERHNQMIYYGFMFFKNVKVPIEQGVLGILPKRDHEGRVIVCIRPSEWNPETCDADHVLRALLSILHFVMQFPATQVSGICGILDSKLVSLSVLLLAMKYLRIIGPILTTFPGRFQKLLIVNVNIVLRNIAPLFLAAFPSKLRKRTTFHGDAKTSLPEIFDRSILPEEFGGTMGPLSTLYQTWFKEYEGYLPKLQATNKYYKRKNTINYPETEEMLNDFMRLSSSNKQSEKDG